MGMRREDIEAIDELELMAISEEAGVTIVKTKDQPSFFYDLSSGIRCGYIGKRVFPRSGKRNESADAMQLFSGR